MPLPPEEEAYQALDANLVGSEGMEGHVDLLGEVEKARGGSRNSNTIPLLRNLREYPGSQNPVEVSAWNCLVHGRQGLSSMSKKFASLFGCGWRAVVEA